MKTATSFTSPMWGVRGIGYGYEKLLGCTLDGAPCESAIYVMAKPLGPYIV